MHVDLQGTQLKSDRGKTNVQLVYRRTITLSNCREQEVDPSPNAWEISQDNAGPKKHLKPASSGGIRKARGRILRSIKWSVAP